MRKVATLVAMLAALLCGMVLSTAEAADTPPDFAIANGHFYSQSAGGGKGGYSITDDGGVPMWSEFMRLGGVDVLGYPVSGRFQVEGHVVQLTQKVGLVWHPETRQVQFLNIFDMLHNAGKDGWLFVTKGIPATTNFQDEAGKSWEQISQQRYKMMDLHPAIKTAYFTAHDPVNMYGLPTSNWIETPMASMLRFNNAVIQQWNQIMPWAAAGEVHLANGGDILKESGILGPAPFALQATPDAPQLLTPPAASTNPIQPVIQSVPSGFAVASFYADYFEGRHTSTGAVFSQDNLTCASNAYPLGTQLRLTTPDGARSVIVTNNDRPASWNTRIDLSKAAFAALYPLGSGIGTVKVEVVTA